MRCRIERVRQGWSCLPAEAYRRDNAADAQVLEDERKDRVARVRRNTIPLASDGGVAGISGHSEQGLEPLRHHLLVLKKGRARHVKPRERSTLIHTRFWEAGTSLISQKSSVLIPVFLRFRFPHDAFCDSISLVGNGGIG